MVRVIQNVKRQIHPVLTLAWCKGILKQRAPLTGEILGPKFGREVCRIHFKDYGK